MKKTLVYLFILICILGCKSKTTDKSNKDIVNVTTEDISCKAFLIDSENDESILNSILLFDNNNSTGIFLKNEGKSKIVLELSKEISITSARVYFNYCPSNITKFNRLSALKVIIQDNEPKPMVLFSTYAKITDMPKKQFYKIAFEFFPVVNSDNLNGIYVSSIELKSGGINHKLTPVWDADLSTIESKKNHIKNSILNSIYENNMELPKNSEISDETININLDLKELQYSFNWIIPGYENEDYIDETVGGKIEFNVNWDYYLFSDNQVGIFVSLNKISTNKYLTYYMFVEENKSEVNSIHGIIVDVSHPVARKQQLKQHDKNLYEIGIERKFSYNELKDLNEDELAYLRNEFYARHGYKFKTEKMQNYFGKMDWYEPLYDNVNDKLSEIELENIFFIKSIEDGLILSDETEKDNMISSLYMEGQTRKLTKNDLAGLSVHELAYLRNEFFARKGYIFKTKRMKTYFEKKDWYNGKYDDVTDMLTDIENSNIQFIKSLEESYKK